MLVEIVILLSGFTLLIIGADKFVEGASSLASRFRISPIFIGLTIVAFGTSAPELIVNIFASLSGNTDISYGNIIGSNIVNIVLILGICGIIRPLQLEKNTVWKEIPFALLAVLALFTLVNDALFCGSPNILTLGDGIILLLFFIIFLTYSFGIPKVESQHVPTVKTLSINKTLLYLVLGLGSLLIGGNITVMSATKIARFYGVTEKLIGLTIIAIGTSLPELMTSVVATYKGKSDIAVGNIIGSNIFNIFLILGVSAFVGPMPFKSIMNVDLLVLAGATIFLFFTMFSGKKRILDRWEAAVLLAGFIIYTIYLFYRN